MSSGDRLFLENQIRQFDVMGRMLMDMRSVLVRRQRLLERTPHRRPQPIRPQPAVPRRASNLVLNLQQAGANMLFDRPEGLGEVVLNMDDLLAMEDAMMAPQPPRMSRVRVRMPKKVIKVIKKADLEKSMEDVCSICQDSYVKKDSVTASCGNQFCASCFEQFAISCIIRRKLPINWHKNYTKVAILHIYVQKRRNIPKIFCKKPIRSLRPRMGTSS